MSERNPNDKTSDEESVTAIDKMKCPVDDEVYEAAMGVCPTHDEELVPIDPEEDQHLL